MKKSRRKERYRFRREVQRQALPDTLFDKGSKKGLKTSHTESHGPHLTQEKGELLGRRGQTLFLEATKVQTVLLLFCSNRGKSPHIYPLK